MNDIKWMRAAERIVKYLEETIRLAGAERKEDITALFENTVQVFPQWAIMTCRIMHPSLSYLSQNASSVLGHNPEYLADKRSFERFNLQVHDNDRQDLNESYSFFYRVLQDVSHEKLHDLRAVLFYRFRKANGESIHLHHELASLELKDGSNFYYGLLQDISETSPFTGVRIEVFSRNEPLKKIAAFKPSSLQASLSNREQEIVSLIRRGLSTKEIGSSLHISPYTVRNIKSRLFEKYKVNSSIELLARTG